MRRVSSHSCVLGWLHSWPIRSGRSARSCQTAHLPQIRSGIPTNPWFLSPGSKHPGPERFITSHSAHAVFKNTAQTLCEATKRVGGQRSAMREAHAQGHHVEELPHPPLPTELYAHARPALNKTVVLINNPTAGTLPPTQVHVFLSVGFTSWRAN